MISRQITEPSLLLSEEEFEECYGRKPEVINFEFDPSDSLKIDEITLHNDYENSSLDFMSPIDKSEEAYFGENNAYKIGMIALIGELRDVYNKIGEIEKSKERKKIAEQLLPVCSKIERFVEETFNIERCYFGLFEETNANSLPLCWDKNLVTVTKTGNKRPKRLVNREFKASLEDIMETKSGYKYRDKKGKIYVINFGLGFFKKNYSNEECAAIITHELGHAMQQAMCSINQDLAMTYIKYLFDEIHMCLNPFFIFGSMGFSALAAILTGVELHAAKKADPEDIGDDVIIYNIGAQRKEFDRERWGQQSEQNTVETVDKLGKNKPKKGFFFFVGRFISKFIRGVFTILYDIIYPIFKLTDIPGNIFQLANIGFLKKNRKFEQFADMFCSVYGLGPAQASALAKLGSEYYKQDYGQLTWINYVPVINVALGFGHYLSDANAQLLAGYPNAKKRVVAIYKTLQYEIDENKDLTPQMKSELKNQIESLNKIYDEYVYDWSPKGFVYALFHKLTFKKLKNERSDVQKNILEAMKELSEETKFKEAKKNEKPRETNFTKTGIMAALISVSRSIREVGILKGFMKEMEPEILENI